MAQTTVEKMANLSKKVRAFFDVNSQIKDLEKLSKPLNTEIKEIMKDMKTGSFEVEGISATLKTQERVSMDEDKLLAMIKAQGFTEAIITVEKVDPEILNQLVYEGKIAAADLEPCTITKYVDVLTVSQKKVKK